MGQGKVSMVVPCYNKELHIGDMLRSVYNQVWDNIELILVNDGSTDGTRDIISQWEPKLRERGYEVVIIDQENAGCCVAVYNGLICMTGDYFCLVDCDDEIRPEYVSRMAGWLDGHEDYEWASCSYDTALVDGEIRTLKPKWKVAVRQSEPDILENYLLWRTISMSWIYMMRVSYIKKCGMIEAFCTDRHVTYEPCITVAPAAAGGRMKFFDEPLYVYNKFASELSGFDSFEKVINYYKQYLHLLERAIGLIALPEDKRARYTAIARIMHYFRFAIYRDVPGVEKYHKTISKQLGGALDKVFCPPPRIEVESIGSAGFMQLYYAVIRRILAGKKPMIDRPELAKRIIGYGALGTRGRRTLPKLLKTALCPTELWDKSITEEGEFCNIKLKAPDIGSLTSEDIVLVFPVGPDIMDELRETFDASKAGCVLYCREIEEYLAALEFPSLAEAVFCPTDISYTNLQ